MAEKFIPEANPNAPNTITLLSILKAFNSTTNVEFPTRFTDVNELLSDNIHPLFENIEGSPYSNEELGEILLEMARGILVNKQQIEYTKHLLALLTFTLLDQGVEVTEKELLENLKLYLKYK